MDIKCMHCGGDIEHQTAIEALVSNLALADSNAILYADERNELRLENERLKQRLHNVGIALQTFGKSLQTEATEPDIEFPPGWDK